MWSKSDIVAIGLSLESKNWPLFFQNCRTVYDMWVSFRLFCYDLFENYVPTVMRAKCRKFKYPNNVKRLLRQKKAAFKSRLSSAHHMRLYKHASQLCSAAIRNFHRDRERDVINSGRSSVFKFIRSKLSSKPRIENALP